MIIINDSDSLSLTLLLLAPRPRARVLDLDLDWVKSQDLSERVIVEPSDLSRLRNPLLSPPYGAPGQCATGNPAGTGPNRRL